MATGVRPVATRVARTFFVCRKSGVRRGGGGVSSPRFFRGGGDDVEGVETLALAGGRGLSVTEAAASAEGGSGDTRAEAAHDGLLVHAPGGEMPVVFFIFFRMVNN